MVLRQWKSETWKFGFTQRVDKGREAPPCMIWKAGVLSVSCSLCNEPHLPRNVVTITVGDSCRKEKTRAGCTGNQNASERFIVVNFCVRWFIRRYSNSSQKVKLSSMMWKIWPYLPDYGRRAAQFVDLLGYFSIKCESSAEEVSFSHWNRLFNFCSAKMG